MAVNLGIPETWLVDGVGESPTQLGSSHQMAVKTVALVDIVNPKAITFPMASTDWLHYTYGISGNDVIWWHAPDMAMWPEITLGDPVLLRRIDPIITEIHADRLLLVRHGDKHLLRVVAVDKDNPQGGVVLHAWNPTRFPPVRVRLSDLEGIGELLWSGRSWGPGVGGDLPWTERPRGIKKGPQHRNRPRG